MRWPNSIKTLVIILLLTNFLAQPRALAMGSVYEYVLTGTLYFKSKPLRNQDVIIRCDSSTDTNRGVYRIRTDNSGAYWLLIQCRTPCPEGNYPEDFNWNEAVSPSTLQFEWNRNKVLMASHARYFNLRRDPPPIAYDWSVPDKIDWSYNKQTVFYCLGADANALQRDVIQNVDFDPKRGKLINSRWRFKERGNPAYGAYARSKEAALSSNN